MAHLIAPCSDRGICSQSLLVQIEGSENETHSLEAQLALNPDARFADTGVLLIHPYSLLGGSMHDAVVSEVFRQATASGQFGAVMRYNQRAVGLSTGNKFSLRNFRGQEDAADVLEMVEFLGRQLPQSVAKRIVVIGYSWGSCLAAFALDHPDLSAYVGISFPLGGLASILKTRQLFERVCKASQVPRLLLLGDQDQYTKEESMQEALQAGGGVRLQGAGNSFDPGAMGPAGSEATAKPLLLKVFASNDHFWSSDVALMVEFTLAHVKHILES